MEDMDYLLFNSDGSIRRSNLNQYVQEGDNNKQVLVAVIGLESGTALPEAICRLPNGQSVTLAGVWNEDEHGWIFTFTSSVTLYPGVVLVAIRISENGINRVMFPFSLMVNQTGVNPNTDTGISLEELDAYLLTIKNWINALNIENGSGENSLQQKGNIASGKDSFAIGLNNVASNVQSHAEGYGTQAVGNFSHSEGQASIAWGDISHVEGVGNVVGNINQTEVRDMGEGSHAEGYGNIVYGKYSHVSGRNNIVWGNYQNVVGRYNDGSDGSPFVVGCGTSESNRKNGFGVRWDGTVFAGANATQNNDLPRYSQVRLWKHTIYLTQPASFRLVVIDKNSESMAYLLQIQGRTLDAISHKLINENNNMIMQLIGFPVVNLQVNIKYIDENGVIQTTPLTINTDSVTVYE